MTSLTPTVPGAGATGGSTPCCRHAARLVPPRSIFWGGCARPAGPPLTSSPRPTAPPVAYPSPTTRATKRYAAVAPPRHRPLTGPAPCCATTASPAPWCSASSTTTGPTRRRPSRIGSAAAARPCWKALTWSLRCRCIAGDYSPGRYNESGLLAHEIVRAWGLEFSPDLLHRTRPGQGGLNRRERFLNVRGAFKLRPARAVEGRRVILLDDVMTTGATANACARALKRAGVESVDVLALV